MEKTYLFVALADYASYCIPVAAAHTTAHIEEMLAEYTKGEMIGYEAYNPKWPDDFQGWYTYREREGDEVRFKLYCVDYMKSS